ncbi:beta-2 adrenergic receptor-like [Oppia nitens]|uniref:beta-2 adrenergic receptor-like n=1 Tax=Oppia nitens TaxID=1686743 RepID=UPI0023DBBD0A|nr:beta-2 adrenergic receptor-like [Oppia nitens]
MDWSAWNATGEWPLAAAAMANSESDAGSNQLVDVPPVYYSHAMGQPAQCPYSHGCAPYAVSPNPVSWNGVLKLVLYSLVSTLGSMGGIFVISAITVIDTFQVRGNSYLVCLAFGHLLVTILVVPASAVAIMAGVPDDVNICHFQWLTTLACLIVSVLSFMFMSIDNYYGFGSLVTYDLCCTKCRIVFIILIIWFLAIVFPVVQHVYNFGPNFCDSPEKRSLKVFLDFHPYVLGAIILFTLITIWYFTRSLFEYKKYKMQIESSGDPTAAYILTDGYLLQSNCIVYLISLAMWMPFVVAMIIDPINRVPQDYLDTMWWIALSNSCTFSYLYAATNRDFREAFNKLFYYCCCKSHVTFARKGAAMRRGLAADSIGLRVHIIPGLNIYAQRKDATCTTSYRTGCTGIGSTGPSAGSSYHSGGFGGFVGGGPFAKAFTAKSCEL